MVSFSGGGAMTQPRAPIRQITSDGAITVDEKLTLRSLVAATTIDRRMGTL
jgi:hypothetical protein